MEKVLTISVAAYNVEAYLPQLLDSLVAAKRCEALEIIVVNDGSSDNTAGIAAEYESKYKNCIRLVNKENGGHGSTINRAIKLATGKYFKIIDGDDWVDSKQLAGLVDYLKDCEDDLVLTDYTEYYDETGDSKDMSDCVKQTRMAIPENEHVNFAKIAGDIERLRMHMITLKTRLLQSNGIKVDEKCFYVDTEFVFYSVPYIYKASYPKYNVYCYRLGRPGQSMTSDGLRRHVTDHVKVNRGLIARYKRINDTNAAEGVILHLSKMLSEFTMLTYRILLSFPCKQSYGDMIHKIDEALYNNCRDVYNDMNSGWLKGYRYRGYSYYPYTWLEVKGRAIKEHLKK